jgi:glucose-6-phosphate 1-dehydrogenase
VPIQNTALIILGASGDLSKKKLIPALFSLHAAGHIATTCRIIGSGRKEFTQEAFRAFHNLSGDFASAVFYHQGLAGLQEFLDTLGQFGKYMFFFALPPETYAATAQAVREAGFKDKTFLIIEKPFGRDYESAKILNEKLHQYFDEEFIFRIDHYLAKEAVQNILVFRFANSLFYPIWNSRYIESIQINAIENFGVASRSQYFDSSGIIRDMVQNHLLQLLSLIGMEAPVTLSPEDVRSQKINFLKSLELVDFRRYQYSGYSDETGIPKDSDTETFAELKFIAHNFRWEGTPIYIRTGKSVHRSGMEIGLRFRGLPKLLFNEKGDLKPNEIIFKIQPQAGIIVDLASKIPGSEFAITGTNMQFCYVKSFKQEVPEAYQKLLLDALKNDHTLFVSAEETEIAWSKIAPSLKTKIRAAAYEPGQLPESLLYQNWIDFDKYRDACD